LLSSAGPESTSAKLAGEVPKETEKPAPTVEEPTHSEPPLEKKSSPPGAFPETPSQESESFAVNPIPASSGPGNPISVPAGEKLPDHKGVTGNSVESAVTTSKEDYEKDASSAIPEEKSFKVDPIPASSGISNPVSVPTGESVKQHKSWLPESLYANATTSKEDYEKAGSAEMPIRAVGEANAEGKGDAFSVPEKSKDMIPESSLPMSGEAKDTNVDVGPFVQSSGPGTTTAALAGQVPLEPRGKATVMEDEAPSATLSGPAPDVPEVVKESMAEAHKDPEAAASPEAVEEKKEVEQQLLREVKSTDAAGEPAPTAAAATTATAPAATETESKAVEPVEETPKKAEKENPLGPAKAGDKEGVHSRDISPMGRDPNAPTPQVTTGVAQSKTSEVSTPKKPAATPASSAASSPATNSTKDKKKKRKSFFGKLKEAFK
jgi:hypothetical protein